MANLINVRLQRSEGQPWGFRLQGGKDFSSPLVLQRVNGGSVADQAGLMPGDALVKVNNTDVFNLRHKEAQDVIMSAGNSFELSVSRGSAWRPAVTPTGSIPSPSPSMPGHITPVTKTSLAATPQPVQHIGSGHNQAAKPFPAVNGGEGPIKSIVNKQYNTPVAMYSDETIAETLSSQAEVLAGGVLGVNFKKNERVYSPANSEVYKLLHEQGDEPEPASSHFYATQSHAIGGYATAGRLPVGPLTKPRSPVPPQMLHPHPQPQTQQTQPQQPHHPMPKPPMMAPSMAAPAPAPVPAPAPAPVRPAPQTAPRCGIPPRMHPDGQKSGVQAISAALNAHANLNGRSHSPYATNNQSNILPKPFGAPLPVSSHVSQVQPPASYPPVSGSVPTPFAAACQPPTHAPASAPAPQPAVYPPVAAPAPAPVAAAPAAVPTQQDDEEEPEDYEEEQKFGTEIPSQMENMPVPSGRLSMTDALATAPERPYTPFTEVKFERSETYQEMLKEQPSIQVDPEQNFSAFASVGGNRTPMPFKPIIPEIREPCEQPPEPEQPAPEPNPEPEPEPKVEEKKPKPEKPKKKLPPYPRKDAGSDHYSLAPRRETSSPLHQPAEIPNYQRKWYNLPTQNPPHTPEPEELRQNVPLAFVDTHSKAHLAKPIAQTVNTVNIRDQVTLKKAQPFTTIQNRTIPVIQPPLEEDAELAQYNQYNNAHSRLQAKGVIDRGQSFTPSLILTKHPTTIPYYQHQLGFEEYFAESKQFDGRRTPQPARKSPAFGPPPNPLKGHVPPTRDDIPNESGLYLSMGKLTGVPWYAHKAHVPADIQQKMVQQQHGMGGGYDASRHHKTVSYHETPMTVQTQQHGDMTVQTRSQESAMREQASSERTINSASQVGNALIQKRTRIVEEHEHSQTAKAVEISKFSSKIKEEEVPQKGYVAQQTRRFSGQDDALNIPSQLQQQEFYAVQQPEPQPQPQVMQSFPTQPPQPAPSSFPSQMSQPAPSAFPSTALFPEPIVDRFPSKSSRKASVLLPSASARSPTPTSGFKAQFNEFMIGAGSLGTQHEEPEKELTQSWPPQLPSFMSNTNPTANVRPPQPAAPPAPVAPVAVTNGRRPSNNSITGFSNNSSNCNSNTMSCQNNNTDRSGASAGSGVFNKGRAACQTIAPNRGRGIMNQAVAPGGRIPLCGCCNQQIRGPFITALGRIWCPDHFICHNANCKRPLADIGFVEEKGDLYCEYCFEEFLAPLCNKCNTRVKGDCLNAIGKQFHPECFKCAYCGKLFGNSPFFLEEGDPYCEADWNELFTTKCFACGFPVEAGDKWVEALNNNYHSQCFNCTSCKKNLEGQSFFAKGGRPFCKNHAR